MSNSNLYIFIDESGNFDFSPTGTKYFVLTAITTTKPLYKRSKILQLRYNLLSKGHNQESFHATEDRQFVRGCVFKLLGSLDDFAIDSVVAQKNKANPSLYQKIKLYDKPGKLVVRDTDNEFYRLNCQVLLQYIFRRYEPRNFSKIIVVLSSLFTKRKRDLVLKALKPYLKRVTTKPYYIYFHCSEADINCQIADYCSWALYVKNERNELRPFQEIAGKVKSEFDIFRRGKTTYYEYDGSN